MLGNLFFWYYIKWSLQKIIDVDNEVENSLKRKNQLSNDIQALQLDYQKKLSSLIYFEELERQVLFDSPRNLMRWARFDALADVQRSGDAGWLGCNWVANLGAAKGHSWLLHRALNGSKKKKKL